MPADLDPFAGPPDDVAVLLRGYRPLLGALSGLVLWAQETGLDVVAEVLLVRDVIDRYAVGGVPTEPADLHGPGRPAGRPTR